MVSGRTRVVIEDTKDGHIIRFGRLSKTKRMWKETCVPVSKKALEMLYMELEERDYRNEMKRAQTRIQPLKR